MSSVIPESRSVPDTTPAAGIRPGSEAHKALFCRTLLDTFNPYKPAVIDWPELDAQARERLVSLPIWDIAVQTEGRARLNVASYAAVVRDPLLREAVELNAFEEGRHKHVLANLVTAYGITLAPEPEYVRPRDPEWAFMVTGYSECIDSFFAFGLFESAKRSGFFPAALVDTFEPVMQEEARHILFFSNWAAHRGGQIPVVQKPWFLVRRIGGMGLQALGRVRTALELRRADAGDDFTMQVPDEIGDIDLRTLATTCVSENERRLAPYDPELLRPRMVPTLVGLALRFVPGGTARG
jgi:hypothetical protein